MNILVIGGAGYIGSAAVQSYIDNGHKVIILDDLSTGFAEAINPNTIFHEGDMLNEKLVDELLEKYQIDVVALFAAKIVVPESTTKADEYFLTNIGGLATVLKCMKKTKTNKIIFASSAAVYGQCEKTPISENDVKKPINPYGESKLAGEALLEDVRKANGINYVIYRFFNVAGASDNKLYGMRKEKPSLLISAVNDAILRNKPVKIFGDKYNTTDGTCVRDYIHVQDVADACVVALDHLNNNSYGIFNLSSNKTHTVKQVVLEAYKCANKKPSFEIHDNRPGDPEILLGDNSLVINKLNWQPKRTLVEMIESDYHFRKNNVYKTK